MTEAKPDVYVKITKATLGSGATARKQEIRNYYIIDERGEEIVKVRLLDMDGNPLGLVEEVEVEEFDKLFVPQPDYFNSIKSLHEVKIDRILLKAEDHYEKKEYLSAEHEFGQAIKLDEENVRANFGSGKNYLAMGDIEKAKATFEKVTQIDAVFEDQNKHIFNELGIELRKLGLFGQAVSFYKKALSITKDDENLYFNLGRALYEKGDLIMAARCLKKSLSMNDAMPAAKRLFREIAIKIKAQKQAQTPA